VRNATWVFLFPTWALIELIVIAAQVEAFADMTPFPAKFRTVNLTENVLIVKTRVEIKRGLSEFYRIGQLSRYSWLYARLDRMFSASRKNTLSGRRRKCWAQSAIIQWISDKIKDVFTFRVKMGRWSSACILNLWRSVKSTTDPSLPMGFLSINTANKHVSPQITLRRVYSFSVAGFRCACRASSCIRGIFAVPIGYYHLAMHQAVRDCVPSDDTQSHNFNKQPSPFAPFATLGLGLALSLSGLLTLGSGLRRS
jgi:hypothetical protein